jgi:hypothetical protein
MDKDWSVSDICTLVDEYSNVSVELEKIKAKVYALRQLTKRQLTNAKSDQEKQQILAQFRKEIKEFKTEVEVVAKGYKMRKEMLRDTIINKFNSLDNDLGSLTKKYLT